jgi:hypothetical protein
VINRLIHHHAQRLFSPTSLLSITRYSFGDHEEQITSSQEREREEEKEEKENEIPLGEYF